MVASIDGYQLYLPESLKAYERVVRKEPLPRQLYHYTTTDAAISIIRSGRLWATNVRYMNDTSELIYAEQVISEMVESEAAKLSGIAQRWLREFTGVLSRALGKTETFAACFCEEGDVLSQWRGYAGADGVSLGLTASTLAGIEGGTVARVEYDPSVQREVVRETIAIHLRAFRKAARWRNKHRVVELSGMLAFQLALWAVVLKHPSFAEEREWRYVPLAYEPSDIRRRTGRDEHTYLEIELQGVKDENRAIPLQTVTLSPLTDSRTSERLVSTALADLGHEAVVAASRIPFRL